MEYKQLSEYERFRIAHLQAAGASQRQIAATLDRAPSTVARELKRNGTPAGRYAPDYAHLAARSRRWRGARLERDGPLREQVLAGLGAGWSPAQVAGRLALDEGRQIISHESIYRFIYAQMARKKDYSWRHYLPRAKAKRGFLGRRDGSPATHITHRVPLSQRPHAAADRATFGHWEGDLMHFGNHGPALLALAERHSRLVLLARLPGKGADVTADTIARLLAPLPRRGARPSPSTTAPSSPATTASTPWASRPSSAIPGPPGRRGAWRTPSAACGARYPAKPGWLTSPKRPLRRSSNCTTIPPASASATARLPRPLTTRCCTWNVNSPSCLRRNDNN